MTNPRLTSFSLVRKTKMSSLVTFIHQSIDSPSHRNRQRKEKKKSIQIRKEEVKLSLSGGDMMGYILKN